MLFLVLGLLGIAAVLILGYFWAKYSNERNFYEKRNIMLRNGHVYTVYVIPQHKNEEYRAARTLDAVKMNLLKILKQAHSFVDRYPFRAANTYVVHERLSYAEKIIAAKDSISETIDSRDDEKTSYTISKNKIFMCIRHGYYKTPRKDEPPSFDIYPMETIMYPAIHELAHVICMSIGHTSEFKELNGFLLSVASSLGINASKSFDRGVYCGMKVPSF